MKAYTPLTEADVPALARASGLDDDPARIAALTATLPIVNDLRSALWDEPPELADEPAHIFAPVGTGAR